MQEAIEFLSTKVGLVLLVLGTMHFANIISFAKLRQRQNAPLHPIAEPFPPVRK